MATFSTPSLQDLQKYSDRYGFACSEEDLKIFQEIVAHSAEGYRHLLELPEPQPLVEFPRTPGYRPLAEENTHNAWYWKCEISGAGSGPLAGRRVAIKDNTCVACVPMMNGSRSLEGFIPAVDATVVSRLLKAGASIVGKTTCEDLCLSGASYHTCYGPVRNPWNTSHSAGGSSSGSGVLVALGEVDMATGGDQGGSVRIPASSVGIVGLKPTYGLVPYTGILPIETSLDHVGPMTKTVGDCALMLQAMAGYDDDADCRQPSCGFPVPDYAKEIEKGNGEVKIGVLKEGFDLSTPEVQETVKKAVQALKESSKFASIQEVSIPMHLEGEKIWGAIASQGGVNQMIDGAGYNTGLHGQMVSDLAESFRHGLRLNAPQLSNTVKMFVVYATYIKEKYGLSIYARAQSLALSLRHQYDQALKQFDVLVLPTLPNTPCPLPTKDTPLKEAIGGALGMLANTCPFNITHHPALTLNAGFGGTSGLPVGLMIVGRRWEDATVLRVASAAEQVFKQFQKPLKT